MCPSYDPPCEVRSDEKEKCLSEGSYGRHGARESFRCPGLLPEVGTRIYGWATPSAIGREIEKNLRMASVNTRGDVMRIRLACITALEGGGATGLCLDRQKLAHCIER